MLVHKFALVKNEIISFVSAHVIAVIAWILALVSMIFVFPDNEYLTYIDGSTLGCLFCLVAAVRALRNGGAFEFVGMYVVRLFSTTRACVSALVALCFFSSMVITNDAALLTFLPLAYLVLYSTGELSLLVKTFVLQTIAANLGGMILPFGNPQNLYLYTYFQIPTEDFIWTMFPSFMVSFLLIALCCLFIPKRPLELQQSQGIVNKKRLIFGFLVFTLALMGILRVIPWVVSVVSIGVALLLFDREALKRLDWGLLLTFVAFFIFAGNVVRIPCVSSLVQACVNWSEFGAAVCASQVVSNVPAAIILSQFTSAWQPLLVGVNIGGVGTPLGSLASLITINEYTKLQPGGFLTFIGQFLIYNFAFLGALVVSYVVL